MIYFENYQKGHVGLNNHVIPYTLCIAVSHFLDRDFYFEHETNTRTPPEYATTDGLHDKFSILMHSPPSRVSDLLDIPSRRVYEIDRDVQKKFRIEDPMRSFLTTEAQQQKFGETFIWNYFSLGRDAYIKDSLLENDVIEFGSQSLVNATYFFFLDRAEKCSLLDTIKINYRADLEKLAARISGEFGDFNAIHLRLGDFRSSYGGDGYRVVTDRFKKSVEALLKQMDVPLLVATDGLHEKELFSEMLSGFDYRFIDEIVFENYFDEYRELDFTDYNALSVINQIICANAGQFIGTCRSTFTSVIHRIRQERYGKTDFDFFPDERVSRVLSPEFELRPDQQGFFEWNRYSIFSEGYEYPGWMREWTYDLTSIA